MYVVIACQAYPLDQMILIVECQDRALKMCSRGTVDDEDH